MGWKRLGASRRWSSRWAGSCRTPERIATRTVDRLGRSEESQFLLPWADRVSSLWPSLATVGNRCPGLKAISSTGMEDEPMQYMIVSTVKDTASPSDLAALIKKFQSWQPPADLTMEGN